MLLSFERVIVGAFAFVIPGATLLHRNGLVQAVLPESKNMSKRTIGVPQELGRSCRLLGKFPVGVTGLPTPGLGGGCSSAEERKERVPTEVPPSEGNEARWEGRQEVAAS